MSEPTKPSGLAAAVCAVMGEVGYVQKTGVNSFHKYRYASDADLLEAVQPAMAKHGLILHPRAVERSITAHGKSKSGSDQWRTDVTVTYSLLHTSGEKIDVIGLGCGIDGEDKGAYKAMTGALKYAIRQTFLIPTGDDPERDAPQQQPQRPAQQQARPQQQAPAKAPAQQQQPAQPAKLTEVQKPAQKPAAPAQPSEALVKARQMAIALLNDVPAIRQFLPGSLDEAHADRIINKCRSLQVRMSEPGAAQLLAERLDTELAEAEAAARQELERSGDPFEARV